MADILNIAGIRQVGGLQARLDPLLRFGERLLTRHRNDVLLRTRDEAGVIGKIGTCFGNAAGLIQSLNLALMSADAAQGSAVP